MSSPRPILKQAQSIHHHHHHRQQQQQQQQQPHPHGVHFPPSPALTRTFTAHSAAAYDRSPIVVTQNSCALPERGCPGRTYLLDESAARHPRGIAYARDYHPRALAFASAGGSSSMVPQLIPDMSSESDESDSLPAELSSTYCVPNANAKQYHSGGYSNQPNMNMPHVYSSNTAYSADDDDLSPSTNTYLPYSPSSPSSPSGYHHWDAHPDDSPHHTQKPRRKKDGRRHESSRDPDRIRSSPAVDVAALTYGIGNLSMSPPSPMAYSSSPSSATRQKGVRRQHGAVRPTPSFVGGGFGPPDDGCLGGF